MSKANQDERMIKLQLTKEEIEVIAALFRSLSPGIEDIDYPVFMTFATKFRKACGLEG